MAPGKTEAVVFVDRRSSFSHGSSVNNVRVPVADSIKYLGVILDSVVLSFRDHFRAVLARAKDMAAILCRLMPNLRGPSEWWRQLYAASVIRSVLMYGAPVWTDALSWDRRLRDDIAYLLRRVALRIISAYRMVLHIAASILSCSLPADIAARRYRRVFFRTRHIREVTSLTERARRALHAQESRAIEEWKTRLLGPDVPSVRFREALVLNLRNWVVRGHGCLTFRITQIITGHGCFGAYLHRIGRALCPYWDRRGHGRSHVVRVSVVGLRVGCAD